jgi:hypothetical protein
MLKKLKFASKMRLNPLKVNQINPSYPTPSLFHRSIRKKNVIKIPFKQAIDEQIECAILNR